MRAPACEAAGPYRSVVRLTPYVGSDELRAALGPRAQCGCALRAQAVRDHDEGDPERRDLEEAAVGYQRAWRCPGGGFPEPRPDAPPLTGACGDAVATVGRMTGFRGARTCPLHYAAQPWVRHVLNVRVARDAGSLDAGVAKLPLEAALLEAMAEVDHAQGEKFARELARQREAAAEREQQARGVG